MKTAHVLLSLAILTALPGCGYLVTGYHEAACWTSRQWSAEKAWHKRKWMYADMPCRGSFKAGFKAGYRFANGGYDSCEPPQLRHYWRVGGLTESERMNAQAWSEGFTHGTLAARQEFAVGPSAFDMAAMQPPEGVPDVRYYNPPQMSPETGQGAPYQFSPGPQTSAPYPAPQMPAYSYEMPPQAPPTGGNFPYAPNVTNDQYSPPPAAVPPSASEAMPAAPGPPPSPLSPPPAPASMPTSEVRIVPTPLAASEGYPGIGSRAPMNVPPAPAAELSRNLVPQLEAGSPTRQATQAADWEMPLIRE